jgi:hypothetical protein
VFNIRHKGTKQVNSYEDQAGVDGFLAEATLPQAWEDVSDAELAAEAQAERDAAEKVAAEAAALHPDE